MMKSRGAAVIGAFVLIALAIFVRGRFVGSDDGGSSDGPRADRDAGRPTVACSPEVIAVCDALADAGRIAADPPALDLPAAAQPPADVDGWITWDPAPQVANFVSSPNGTSTVWGEAEVLGSAPQRVLVDAATRADLAGACAPSTTWACLAGLAATQSIGVGDPATAEGLARLAPFASALAEDDDYNTLDAAALDDVVLSPAAGQVDAATGATRLATQPGFLSMVTGPEALLKRQAATEAGRARDLRVIEPTPSTNMVLVLAPRAGRAGDLDGLACEDLPEPAEEAVTIAGMATCTGAADPALAGFLYQVQKKVG